MDRVMAAQQADRLRIQRRRLVGRSLDILIDGPAPEAEGRPTSGSDGVMLTHPDVDGLVYVAEPESRDRATSSAAQILAADGYDLVARPEATSSPDPQRALGQSTQAPQEAQLPPLNILH